jgi:hypothetical protein
MAIFIKKVKTFSEKKILKLAKQPIGSIAIIVLIIGIAIVLAVSALSAYMVKDIKFTQIDAQKLKALNIAEAGVSNMYSNLYKYYNNSTPLPVSPFQGELKDGTEVLGTYYVEYAPFYTNGVLAGYIINSKGVEAKSLIARKVGVKVNIVQQGSLYGIYDYIYTGISATFGPNGNVIDGPFYTEGDLNLTNGAGMLQLFNTGPVVVKGNLTMSGDTVSLTSDSLSIGGDVLLEGSAKIKGGPVNIGGNLTMSGGTLIGNPLASPMIIMKNLNMSGSATIGKSGDALVLSLQGTETHSGVTPVYATRDNSLTYTFSDPMFNVISLVDNYKTAIQSSALVITGNLNLVDTAGFSYSNSSGANSLSFAKDPVSGRWILQINGNVIINGTLTIGGTSFYPLSTNIMYYSGKGIIYTTGAITTHVKLMPLNAYPTNDLLIFLSDSNINLDIFNFYETPDCASANIYTVAVSKGNISVLHGTVRGTLLAAGSLNIDKDFGKVCYEDAISQNLPPELPNNTSGSANTTFTQVEWQELNP